MNLFIIGDVHGCFHTFSELLKHWQPATDHLIQVGDLVDRGNYSPAVVELARQLQERHPTTMTFLKGNHEAEMLRHYGPHGPNAAWLSYGGAATVLQYRALPEFLAPHLAWLAERPLLWENEALLVSHAGIADTPNAYNPDDNDGLLWRRALLKNIDKWQVVGHTPTKGQPLFDDESRTCYLDTGAYQNKALTGIRFSPEAKVLDIISVPTVARDLPAKQRR